MPRALRYHIEDAHNGAIDKDAWKDIMRLQHWYNSEFFWSCDKISLKRYLLFPNYERMPDMPYRVAKFHFRKRLVQKRIELGDEIAAVRAMVEEGFFHVRWGGVRDNAFASGISHVAGNEFNALLLCEFLLKCSYMVPDTTLVVEDEGHFIRCKRVSFLNGQILVAKEDLAGAEPLDTVDAIQVFTVVNPEKYDDYPPFVERIDDLSELDMTEDNISDKFGSFGFDASFETQWGDGDGVNLQQRAKAVVVT